ncbi:2TM domain-containing protein [Robiginitalea sp. IMCC43444]|uniref:2TM domain-containing protein n=1 Tax=Robiginitalea sp. IMCC43444 TaxID=3459121 RepID=UPI0040426B88
MENSQQHQKYLRAKERLEELKKFYNDLAAYIIVNGILLVINYYDNMWREMWVLFVIAIWGIVLVFQALRVFNLLPFLGPGWEARKMEELMREEDSYEKKWK